MNRFTRQSSALWAIAALILAIGSVAYAEGDADAPDAKESDAKATPTAQQPAAGNEADASPAQRPRKQKKGKGKGRKAQRGFPPGMAEVRLVQERPEEIGVDQEILTKLDSMAKEFRAEESRLSEEMRKTTAKVSKLLEEGRPNDKAILEASKAASAVGREIRTNRLQLTLNVRALLTDEQLEKFMALRKKAMESNKRRGRPRS